MQGVPVMVRTNCKGSLSFSASLSLLMSSLLSLFVAVTTADVEEDASASSLACLTDVDAAIPGGR